MTASFLFVTIDTVYFISLSTSTNSRDRIVVSTLRCGRSNPGSNPGHGSVIFTRCHGGVQIFFEYFGSTCVILSISI